MDFRLLPEGSFSNTLCPGWMGLAAILSAHLRALEAYRSWRNGRLQPITFSVEQMIRRSLFLSLAVTAANQLVMEVVRRDYWWMCKSAPSLFLCLAGWTTLAATGSTSSVVLLLWGSSHLRFWVILVPKKQKDFTVWRWYWDILSWQSQVSDNSWKGIGSQENLCQSMEMHHWTSGETAADEMASFDVLLWDHFLLKLKRLNSLRRENLKCHQDATATFKKLYWKVNICKTNVTLAQSYGRYGFYFLTLLPLPR